MSDWEHVDKEEIIISEDGLDEAIHNAYLKGRNDALDKIRDEIEEMDFDFGDFYDHTCTIRGMVLEVIDKYKTESEEV